MGFGDVFGTALNIGSLGVAGKGPIPSIFKQPVSEPFAVESPTQATFGASFQEELLGGSRDELGELLGPSLLQQSLDPRTRDKPFKKAKKQAKKTFDLEQEAFIRSFIEEILPAIRESAGARGTGVSTGTQVAGVRAGEAGLEDIGTRRSAALGRIDLIRAQAQDQLFRDILGGSLQLGGTTGVGQPEFGLSPFAEVAAPAAFAFGASQ